MKDTIGRLAVSGRTLVAILMGLAALVGEPNPTSAQDLSIDQQEIVNLLERVSRLMEAGDLKPLDEIYAPGRDVHIIEGAGVNHGWVEYRDHHLSPELEVFEDLRYRWHSVEARIVGDLAYAAFQYDLEARTERGDIAIEGRGTAVLERINGSWRIVHTHTSGRPRQSG